MFLSKNLVFRALACICVPAAVFQEFHLVFGNRILAIVETKLHHGNIPCLFDLVQPNSALYVTTRQEGVATLVEG